MLLFNGLRHGSFGQCGLKALITVIEQGITCTAELENNEEVWYQAILMGDLKMPGRGVHEVTMPGVMYQ